MPSHCKDNGSGYLEDKICECDSDIIEEQSSASDSQMDSDLHISE